MAAYSEPSYAIAQNTDLPWWRENIDKYLDEHMRSLLETYSSIPRDKQSAHVHEIRNRAWARRTYPCIGLGVFLQPYIRFSPAYDTILHKVKHGGLFLDIGCLFGVEMRQLAYDGAPTDNMIGIDIVSFWDLGAALFCDPGFKGRYVECDVLKMDKCGELSNLKSNTDIISISAVLHQWNWSQQFAALEQIVKLSKVGALVIGHQLGTPNGGEFDMKMGATTVKVWKHDPKTFTDLWIEVGKKTGTVWEVNASLKDVAAVGWDADDVAWMAASDCILEFVVTRVR